MKVGQGFLTEIIKLRDSGTILVYVGYLLVAVTKEISVLKVKVEANGFMLYFYWGYNIPPINSFTDLVTKCESELILANS